MNRNRSVKHMAMAVLVGLSLTVPGGSGVSAQSISRMIVDTGLTPQDFDILSQTARTLYVDTTPVAGRSASWTNPDSGSQGQATLTKVEGNCVNIRHLVRAKAATATREILTRQCKDASGKWLMSAG